MTTLCEPMLLKAAGKHSLWGGDKLIKEYGKDYLKAPLAETWECSTHDNGLSIIDSGIWKGHTLKSVLKEHPEFLGSKYSGSGELPILIKFIDAHKDLSVQVHPDDEYAARYENGVRGKTEMWYVIDAEPQSRLIYGFYDDVNESIVREKLSDGKLLDLLQKVPVKRGDVFYITPGTVHALCGGVIVVEVQENSDLTYRLYDYDRLDQSGHKRSLQIDNACRVCDYTKKRKKKQAKVYRYKKNGMILVLCHCLYFNVIKIVSNCGIDRYEHGLSLAMPFDTFSVFICVAGRGVIKMNDKIINVAKGNTIFVPSAIRKVVFGGCGFEVLHVWC